MADAEPYRVQYGRDIFCNGRRVDPGGGNEGEVADLFSKCLHKKVMQPALLEPKTKEEYEAAVDAAARELFRAICLEDRRRFVQASTNRPIQDREAIEILKVELMELRNTIKIRMKHAAAAAERDQQRRQQEQQEQARRDEERARRDREEFEREQRRRQGQHRRQPPPNGTSGVGGSGSGRWCANPVSPSPAYAVGGDHPAWGGMGQRRQGSSDRRSPFHRSDDHDVFAFASAYDSDGGGRGAGKAPVSGLLKPDRLTQARQRMAEMQRKRKEREPEARAREDDRGPNRGRNNGGRGGGGGRGASSSSFHGHIPRKRSAADKSKGNKSGQNQSNKKQNVGEMHRFKKLVSATEASSPPPKRKATWEPPPGRTHAPTNLPPPTSPGRDPGGTTKERAVSSGENERIGRRTIGNLPQQARSNFPVASATMPETSDSAAAAAEDEGEMAGEFDMDDTESLPPIDATGDEVESQSPTGTVTSPGGDIEFSSDASPFNKKRGLKVSRKKAASEAPSAYSTGTKRSVDEVVGAGDNRALSSKVNQDVLKAKKRLAVEENAEEVTLVPVDVPLPSIVGLDGIVTIEPMGQDEFEKLNDPVMKGRSCLCSKQLPPWPARVATDAESKKCLEEYWNANCNIGRKSHVCVYLFYPPPRPVEDGHSSSDSTSDFSVSSLGPECGIEFVHFSRIRPFVEYKRVVTTESSGWTENYHRAWNVAAALRQWALGSNMSVTLEEKINHYPHEQVGDYGVVFSIKKEEWDSASHIGAQTILNLILSDALVQKHTTYSTEKHVTARVARYRQLGYPSAKPLSEGGSQSHGIAPAPTEASFSNVLNLLGDDDDDDDGDRGDDLFDDGDTPSQAIRRMDNNSSSKHKGKQHSPRMTSEVVYDPIQDSTMDLDDIVGIDGIVMVTGNDANRSIHHPWPARIASAEESDEHRLKELKIGRDVDPYKICVFYFLPCWGDITELAGGTERWYFCDFVESSRIHRFSDPDIDLNGMSDDIVLRYKRAWTIAAGLRYWSFGLEAEAPRKPHKCKVNGCARIHEKIRDYGPVLKIKDKGWVDGSNTLDPDSIVEVINKFLVSKGICRFAFSEEKSKAARGDLGANYLSWLKGHCTNDDDNAHVRRKSTRPESSRPSRSHDLFITYDDSRGGGMTNGGAKISIKSEDNGMAEARKGENTRGTKMELDKIQSVGEFCVKEDEVGSKTMKIFKDFAAVDKNKSTEENRLAKLVEDACNRLVLLEGKLSAHGVNPDD